MKRYLLFIILLCCSQNLFADETNPYVWQNPNLEDGMEKDEADLIAVHYFYLRVSLCGFVGPVHEKKDLYEYPIYFNENESPYEHPLKIYKNGKVELKGYGIYKHFDELDFYQKIVQTTENCYEGYNSATLLMNAIENGNLKFVREVIGLGTNINRSYPMYYGSSALVHALSNGQKEIVQYLLDKGADPRLQRPSINAVDMAKTRLNDEILNILLDKIAELENEENEK